MNGTATLWWDAALPGVRFIEQTLLPGECRIESAATIARLATAIQRLEIRGAPALGVAGGFGVALSAATRTEKDLEGFRAGVRKDAEFLRATRPTAVNLGWGIDRVLAKTIIAPDIASAREVARKEAEAILVEDTESCRAIGRNGAALLPDHCTILTHCNAGALACSSWGTALGVIRSAVEEGKKVKVFACETRPLLQGARLTAWELARDGIDVTVITDSTAATLMRKGAIDAVIVGADRITRDAVFNKIGTYMHAVSARFHGIPFYVAAPLSTFDTEHSECDVRVEERDRDELAVLGDKQLIPRGVNVKNFAFDATPLDLVTAIVTEKGVIRPPFELKRIH